MHDGPASPALVFPRRPAPSACADAREARASNETLYSWYDDKQGLFRALVARNAAEVRKLLESRMAEQHDPLKTLGLLGPKLLELLTGARGRAQPGSGGGPDEGTGRRHSPGRPRNDRSPDRPGAGRRQGTRTACLPKHTGGSRSLPRPADRGPAGSPHHRSRTAARARGP